MSDKTVKLTTINANECIDLLSHQYTTEDLPVVIPKICPCCGRVLGTKTRPIVVVNNLNTDNNRREEDYSMLTEKVPFDYTNCQNMAIYQCGSCDELFVVRTVDLLVGQDYDTASYEGQYSAIFPSKYVKTTFSEDIEELSPEFIKIYNQAEKAENDGLDEICGMAYRKALELLVDAYTRFINPDLTIAPRERLKVKIDTITDNNIKILAERTSWLGNDQTHIISEHPDYDVSDIKFFIGGLVTCIEASIAVTKALRIPKR